MTNCYLITMTGKMRLLKKWLVAATPHVDYSSLYALFYTHVLSLPLGIQQKPVIYSRIG